VVGCFYLSRLLCLVVWFVSFFDVAHFDRHVRWLFVGAYGLSGMLVLLSLLICSTGVRLGLLVLE